MKVTEQKVKFVDFIDYTLSTILRNRKIEKYHETDKKTTNYENLETAFNPVVQPSKVSKCFRWRTTCWL